LVHSTALTAFLSTHLGPQHSIHTSLPTHLDSQHRISNTLIYTFRFTAQHSCILI